ncbi:MULTISPECIES: A24 family peptidase [unclassified Oerskovia]|uniref:prepilin peptidase n=1 Tax=unclassified Oerskovia TaxID=2619021 RepID=UPI0009EAC6C4|nr:MULTISPECIES: A24 family peptidase [unclassified Oerskovia]
MTNAGGGSPAVAPGQDGASTAPGVGRGPAGPQVPLWHRARDEVGAHRATIWAVGVPVTILTVAGAVHVGHPPASLPATTFLAAVGSALAVIDVRTHRLPNALVLPAYPVLAVLLGAASLLGPDDGSPARALAGGLVLYGAYFLLALAPSGLGFGDVKLAGLLGAYLAWFGWSELVVGASAAFLLGGLAAVVLLATRRAGRRTLIPFGPFMLTGAALGALWGAGVVGPVLLTG